MARMSAEQRREEVLAVALEHFAVGGFHGTSTETIARDAGISQPYLFRLFGTKKELFLGCVGALARAGARDLRAGRRRTPSRARELAAMGEAYVHRLLPDRHALLMQMQGYVAVSDPEIQRPRALARFSELRRARRRALRRADELVRAFFAEGMLLNVTAALELPLEPWPSPRSRR